MYIDDAADVQNEEQKKIEWKKKICRWEKDEKLTWGCEKERPAGGVGCDIKVKNNI